MIPTIVDLLVHLKPNFIIIIQIEKNIGEMKRCIHVDLDKSKIANDNYNAINDLCQMVGAFLS